MSKYQVIPGSRLIGGRLKSGFRVVGEKTSIGLFPNIASARRFLNEIYIYLSEAGKVRQKSKFKVMDK